MPASLRHCLAGVLLLAGLTGCGSQPAVDVDELTPTIVERYDFDPTAFTQGLEVAPDGTLLLGTGQYGESRIERRTVDGQVLGREELGDEFFGEGLTRTDAAVWQLTWQNGVAIKRDPETLQETGRAALAGEGWGICARDNEVILSDGTAELRRMDPESLAERERFTVTRDGEPVSGLNELECVGDEIYANVFLSTDIVRIDARTGRVTAVIDASALPNNAAPDANNVLNGIAHIPGTDEFYLTGKRWPDLYRVSFAEAG